MERKIIWMRFLTLGISLMCMPTFVQCKKRVDYFVRADFVYVNNTDLVIEVKSGADNFTIKPQETDTIKINGEGPQEVTEKNYLPPFQGGQIIIYGNIKCDTLTIPRESITGIDNYTSEKIGERYFRFTYTFTDADFADAKPCK